MSKYLRLPKRSYPPNCPGKMQPCDQKKCDIDYCWHKVFLSIPYRPWYKPYEDAIIKGLEEKGFLAEEVRNRKKLQPLTEAISMSICSSAHAIVDLSGVNGEISASGVIMESGFIRSTINNVIHLVREGTKVPTELKTLIYNNYKDKEDLKKIVMKWAEEQKEKYLNPIKSILFNMGSIKDYRVYPHCNAYQHKKSDKYWQYKIDCNLSEALTGGGSGYKLLENTFNALKTCQDNLIEPIRCSTEKISPYEKIPPAKKVYPRLQQSNLYLLDSPIFRNKDGKKQPLNWISEKIIQRLKRIYPSNSRGPLSVMIKIIPPGKKNAKEHPKESIKLGYGEIPIYKHADAAWDYGFIVRAPNPYNPQAIVLIMAGIHAPGTHAAAEVVAIPRRMSRLGKYLEERNIDISNNPFFEAVFGVRRTYQKDNLGDVEWLHARELRK